MRIRLARFQLMPRRWPREPAEPRRSPVADLAAIRRGALPLLLLCLCPGLLACTDGEGEGAGPSDDRGSPAAAPSRPDSADVVAFVDAAGTRHVLERPARRIVSLVPSATETLRAIRAEETLVGVTDFDTGAWTDSLPSVGGGLEPNLEALVALRPDAVIRFGGEQDPRTPARLDELGIRHVAVRPVSLDDVYETNRIVGSLTGRPAAADSLSRAIREGLAALSEATSDLPRQRVVYMLGGSPPWVSGPDTYIDEILDLVGGDNVFDDLEAPYSAVSPEELRSRVVDVVLVSRARAFDASLTPEARVEVIGDDIEVPGPDVVRAAREVAEAVHGRTLR